MLVNKTVLIVEDDVIFSRVLSHFFEHEGSQVRCVENGLEGLMALKESVPDLLISDLSMPVMNGLEFVEEVSKEYPEIPMIVISGTGGLSEIAKALRFGVRDYLIKPLDDINHVKKAVETVFLEQKNVDFDPETLIDIKDEIHQDVEELEARLQELTNQTDYAKHLLISLLPEKHWELKSWHFDYHCLQYADVNPLVFDYVKLVDDMTVFYIVDSNPNERYGMTTSLLVRAGFNDYCRQNRDKTINLNTLSDSLMKMIEKSSFTADVPFMLGMFNANTQLLSILSFDLPYVLKQNTTNLLIEATKTGCRNVMKTHIVLMESVMLSLPEVDSTVFKLNIKPSVTL